MIVIVPLTIEPDNIVETNALSDGLPAWEQSNAPYEKGVQVTHKNHVFESLIDNNEAEPVPEKELYGWYDLGLVNPYLLIDQFIETQTVGGQVLVMDFEMHAPFDYVGVLNVDCTNLTLQILLPDETEPSGYKELWSVEKLMLDTEVSDYWEYFWTEPFALRDSVFSNVPASKAAILRVTLSNPTEQATKIGKIILGSQEEIGCARWGAEAGMNSFSIVQQDEFGRTSIIQRSKAKTADFDLTFKTGDSDRIHRILSSLDDGPALWVGDERFESLTIYGVVSDFGVVVKGPERSEATLEITGMI